MLEIPAAVIQKAAEGDVDAFEELYRRTSSFVYSVAFRVLGTRGDAEEITQDVFVKLFGSLKEFRFRSSFSTWLYRVTVNAALSRLRRRNLDEARREEYRDEMLRDAKAGVQAMSFQQKENEVRVRQMLSVLNPDQRACVVLRDIEGLSYHEIAEVLKVKINTVRTRLKRARDLLIQTFREGETKK